MEKLFKFLNYINEAEHITADTEKERDGQWVVNRNKTNADYEGGDYQQPRVAIMYDGKQGQNGWYWELITGKDVVASGDHTYKTADDAKEAAQFYMADADEDYEEDLGRLGEDESPEAKKRKREAESKKRKREAEAYAAARKRMQAMGHTSDPSQGR